MRKGDGGVSERESGLRERRRKAPVAHAEDGSGQTLQQYEQSERHDHRIECMFAAEGADEDQLDHRSHHQTGHQGGGEHQPVVEVAVEEGDTQIGREHRHRSLAEVHDVGCPPDEDQTQCHRREDHPVGDPVECQIDEQAHDVSVLSSESQVVVS
jgi:hypothetical protein